MRHVSLLASLFCIIPLYAAEDAQNTTFQTSDGVTLHYLNAGSPANPALVFIPGWTMAADIFEPQIKGLSQHFHVVVLDPRSQGDSEKTSGNNTLERRSKDTLELLDHLSLQHVVLLGWSNGVPDVLSFVDQNGTAKLCGVVLIDGLLNLSVPDLQKSMSGMLQSFQADRAKFADGFVRNMYSTPQTDAYITHVKEQSLKTPTNTAVVNMFNILSHGDFVPILAKIDKPVLYICEPYLTAQTKIVQTALPNARVEIIPKAGHALFVDNLEKFNSLISDFANSLNSK